MKKKTLRRCFAGVALVLVGALVIPTVDLALFSEPKEEKFIVYAALENRLNHLFGGVVSRKTAADKVKEEEEKLKELEAQKKKYEAALKEAQKGYDSVLDYIKEMDLKQNEIMLEIVEVQNELVALEEELLAAQEALTLAEKVAEEQYENMKKRLQYIYENGETTYLEILLNSDGLSDMLNQFEYVEKITKYDNNLLQQFIDAKNRVADQKAFIEAQISVMTVTETMYEEDLEYVEELIAIKKVAMEEYEEKIGANHELLEEYLEKIEKQEMTVEEAIKEQEEELRKQQEAAQNKPKPTPNPNLPSSGYNNAADVPKTDETDPSKMIWPLPGDPEVGDGFGPRIPPIKGASTFHKGVDIGGKLGAQIVASLAGKVVRASWNSTGGNHVYIDHGNGYLTRYLHMSQILVKEGQYVQQGQVIGLVGNTGVSTAPHLHFSVYKNNVAVDPMLYIKY